MSSNDRLLPFHVRYASEIRESLIIFAVLCFYGVYAISPFFQSLVDKGVRPSVYGLTAAYGTATTFIYRLTDFDLGFVNQLPDKEFIFRVQLATYANERQASPIIDIAMDQLKTKEQREQALRTLLKFPSHADWIRPFLNEIPKGGMVGLYDEESPPLDELIRQIRLEGGIRKPLIRAYAEVSLSFMLQVPDAIIRKKTLGWVSDVLAEDALFLIIPRVEREQEPAVRKEIDAALWDIRAVSNRSRARELLTPVYRKPPWPSIRVPVAVLLARLGDDGAVRFLRTKMDSPDLSSTERTSVRVALAQTPYPEQLRVSDQIELVRKQRERARRDQYQMALLKQQRIRREERLLAKVEQPKALPPPVEKAVVEKPPVEKPPVVALLPPVQQSPLRQPRVVQPRVEPPPVVKPPVKKPPVVQPPVEEPPVEEPVVEEPVVEEKPEAPIEVPKQPQSRMRYVDMLFEVKDTPVSLYANAGDENPSDVVLDVGSKGKASFEVLINDEKWYQVKSRLKSGWAKGGMLKMYDLAPVSEQPLVPIEPSPVEQEERRETTYFEAVEDGVLAYDKASEKSKNVGTLQAGKPYLATKSEKVGPDRWFRLKLDNGKEGWVAGIDLQLAEVPAAMKEEQRQPAELKSAFAAEWVVAGVEGVLVYDRPSIAAKVLQKISPPIIYKVMEISGEWYKLKISTRKDQEGWVQSMDVNLTKP